MLGKMFGGGGPKFEPMQPVHITDAIRVIAETDEDDAEEAQSDLFGDGCDGMFVLTEKGRVVGLTGASPIEDSHDTGWLSWTYLTESHQGNGSGRFMVESLLTDLNQRGIRKLFISTSDYRENGVFIYEAAHKFYEGLGAVEELRVPRYHSNSEAKIVYGLVNPNITPVPAAPFEPCDGVQINAIVRAPESDTGVALTWSQGGRGVSGLERALENAAMQNARIVVASLPEDISNLAADDLRSHGFQEDGSLSDYYGVGLSQVWWSLNR